MSNGFTVIKVFVASPGDVNKERELVNEIVEEVNAILYNHYKVRFEVIKWETHSTPDMGRAQGVINGQLGIEDSDLFIGILWSRFGSPSGGQREDRTYYDSGTQEEFEKAYKAWQEKKKPHLMFFRCIKRYDHKVDPEQLQKVNAFFKEFSFDKKNPGLITTYTEARSFEKSVRRALLQHAMETAQESDNDNEFRGKIKEAGYDLIFLPENNTLRNIHKEESIKKTESIKLIAHSGHSFIALYASRFRGLIEDRLEKGANFEIILTNPWSESGFFISLSESDISNLDKIFSTSPTGIISYSNPAPLIENNPWFTIKLGNSIKGYHEFKHKDRIKVRFTRYSIPSTILITDDNCYYEPYLPVNLSERTRRGMLTFELKVTRKSSLYENACDYFNFLWNISEDIEVFQKNEELYKSQM